MRSLAPHHRRPGKTLVMFALLLPVLLGMVGLVIDGGLLMASYRQTQNAADAAAMAGAMDLLSGKNQSSATATAQAFVQTYNALASATVKVNIPPASGPYSGNSNYVEAIVSYPLTTSFIQVLPGVNRAQTVSARAVAGYEAVSAGEGAIVLDPTAIPGLSVSGGGTLQVNGRIVVNSQGSGVDQNNNTVNTGFQKYGASTGNNATLKATDIRVNGGVDFPANFQPMVTGDPSPLHAGLFAVEPDPMKTLPTPVAGMTGVSTTIQPAQNINGGTTPLNPGVYPSIKITNSATVTFNPGIYILTGGATETLSITGGATVTGNGVMFYITGNDFNPNTGAPDNTDGENPPSPTINNLGAIKINGSQVSLTGLNNPSSPFNGMLFYQRRWNTSGADVQGNGSNTTLNGTAYAKWANFKLDGSGGYGAQFIVGSMALSGGANITLNYAGKNLGKANQVFLVE